VRRISHGPWCWLSRAAIERAKEAAGSNGILVLAALAQLESKAPEHAKARFYASAQNISTASGLSVRSIFKVLPILQRARLFDMESGRVTEAGGYQANRFSLLDVGPEAPPPYARGAERSADETRFIGTQKRNSPRKGEIKKPRSARSGSKAVAAGEGSEETEPAFIAWK